MKQKIKHLTIILIIFTLFISIFLNFKITPIATSNDTTNIDEIISNLNNEIGEDYTNEMFNELQTEITQLSNVTKEQLKEIIQKISKEYGVVFSEEQLEKLSSYYTKLIEEDEYGFFENLTNLFKSFWNWLKDLHSNSKVSIEPKNNENGNIIETNDNSDTITINIPTVKEVDGIVDKLIDKISEYFYNEN